MSFDDNFGGKQISFSIWKNDQNILHSPSLLDQKRINTYSDDSCLFDSSVSNISAAISSFLSSSFIPGKNIELQCP